MIDKDSDGDIAFKCDAVGANSIACAEELRTDTDNWRVAMGSFREQRWFAKKTDKGWRHKCYNCYVYYRDYRK